MTDVPRPTSSADGQADTMRGEETWNEDNPTSTMINIPAQSSSTVPKQTVEKKQSNSPGVFDRFFKADQVKSLIFYQSLLCEFLGTMLLTIVATSTGLPVAHQPVPDLNGALASGLIVATVIVGFGHISGAHINPAVTITILSAGGMDFLSALCYIGMQLLGAASASALVLSITPVHARGTLGMTKVTEGVTLTQAFVVEFLITFILCYTVHAIIDKHRKDVGGSKALAVGFAVTLGCLFGGPYTGGSMNPARSFGPAWALGIWEHHWIYWFGTIAGSITAALIYTRILQAHPLEVTSIRSQSSSSINRSKKTTK